MDLITQTGIWRRTLAEQQVASPHPDAHPAFRSKLRQAFINFRDQASVLANEIPRFLDQLTVHDITHIDALWQVADTIIGHEYPLTPTEAFVLGGAFLLHDLGMSLASYPGGMPELEADLRWPDVASQIFRREHGRLPTAAELDELGPELRREAAQHLLRLRHAEQAERLATIGYQQSGRDQVYYLIEDGELRRHYGPLIGRIAYSHWWAIQDLPRQFETTVGAFPGGPSEWRIDPLKLALILRTADACHLDFRRAPGFIRALRKPTGESERHWRFQEYVQLPYVEKHRVVFTTTRDSPLADVDVWWLGYEMLSLADRELHLADAINRETGRPPFAANAVAGADDPARLARYFPTCGWKPIATRIHVNDVAGLVRTLGGRALYGDNSHVPLRELIQNARDAIAARRIKEGRDEGWGGITVRLLTDGEKQKVEVHDTGLGMSEELLVGPFLDFGTSYWNSALMLREHPGLSAKGFQPQGRFGIGFFSVFMWGEHIKVVTRRPEEGVDETRVLEFRRGLSGRPILRQADSQERMLDPGTVVHIWLDTRATDAGGLLAPGPIQWLFQRRQREMAWSLRDLCTWLCPALDVNLQVEQGGKSEQAVAASDWERIDGRDLLRRLILHRDDADSVCASELFATLSANIRPLIDESGRFMGRVAFKWFMDSRDMTNDPLNHASLVTAGSFRADHQMDMVGVLLGHAEHASRYSARPIAFGCPMELARWATEQADLVSSLSRDLFSLAHYALLVRLAGGDTRDLPIGRRSTGLCSFNDIVNSRDLPDVVELSVDNWGIAGFQPQALPEGSLAVGTGRAKALSLQVNGDPRKRADHPRWKQYWKSNWGAAIEAIALAWKVPLVEVLEASEVASKGTDEFVDESGRPSMRWKVDIIRKPQVHRT